MAIGLGKFRMQKQKQAESERLAKEYAAQQEKAGERGFFSNILGGVGGKILGSALGGALGVASGGLLMPLIMAGSSMAAKKGAQALTKGMGMGADTSKLVGDKYGFTTKEAKSLKEGLEQQIAALQELDVGKELVSSYTSAFAAGKLGGVKGALQKDGGGLKQALGVGEEYGTEGGWEGMKEGLSGLFGGETKATTPKDKAIAQADTPLTKQEHLESAWTREGLISEEETLVPEGMLAEDIGQSYEDFPFVSSEEDVIPSPIFTQDTEEEPWIPTFQQGGMVQDGGTTPSIIDYFSRQGKTLGGSDTQSLSEILGRR